MQTTKFLKTSKGRLNLGEFVKIKALNEYFTKIIMKLRHNMSIVVARTINQFSFCIMLQTFLAVLTAIVLIYKCHLLKKRNCSHYSRRDHVTMVPDMTTAWTWSPVEPVELCEMASKSIRLPIKLM